MPRQEFDKSSKWMVQHQGRGILYLGGARNVRRYRALQAEIVQPRKLPDGLLEVFFHGEKKPDYVLVEVATYPELRARQQAVDDLMLAYQHFHVLPELLTVVLHPKGRVRLGGKVELRSRLGWSKMTCEWNVAELWTFSAEELLAANDVSLVPWVTLTQFQGPPEVLLERCRQRIEQQAAPAEKENLLAVTQVLARLRFPNPELLALLGGKHVMIESPLIKEIVAENTQGLLLELLARRFGEVPREVNSRLRRIRNEKRLRDLFHFAVDCPNLEAFRARLLS